MTERDTAIGQVATGARFDVEMTYRVADEFKSWPRANQLALLRIMQLLAEHGWENFPVTQFRSEGRFKPKGRKSGSVIYAIKDDHFRLYGGFVERRFICTAFDAAKKQRKADPEKLQRAADYLGFHLGD